MSASAYKITFEPASRVSLLIMIAGLVVAGFNLVNPFEAGILGLISASAVIALDVRPSKFVFAPADVSGAERARILKANAQLGIGGGLIFGGLGAYIAGNWDLWFPLTVAGFVVAGGFSVMFCIACLAYSRKFA